MSRKASFFTGLLAAAAFAVFSAAVPALADNCGNGSVQEQSEVCDNGANNDTQAVGCCAAGCATFVSSATICRVAAGAPCDTVSETCTGASGTCPADVVSPSSTLCRPSAAGVCDSAENCTGTSNSCPSDAVATTGTDCRASAGGCDPVEECNGTSPTCPANLLSPTGTVCRLGGSVCDAGAETCNGTSAACPADVPQNSGALCRPSTGVCDPAENCDGISGACPSNTVLTTVCRPAGGVCDGAESCDGTNGACPPPQFTLSSTVCRAAGGSCDIAENCTGTSAACPTDTKQSSSTLCRLGGSVCDAGPEFCTGTSNACPTDVPQNAGSLCRASGGPCDPQEVCDGVSGACPADGKEASSTLCRASEGVCDLAENCTGTSNNCPTDGVKGTSTVCRPAVSPDCDFAERCDGATVDCPADILDCPDDADGVDCTLSACTVSGQCETQENCEEHCPSYGNWKNRSGDENGGQNVGGEVLAAGGPIEVCGNVVDNVNNVGSPDDLLEYLCIRPQGDIYRKLAKVLALTAMNCLISEGGTCEQITGKFVEVSFNDCNDVCACNDPVEPPTVKKCIHDLSCFNHGGKVIDGECVEGTCNDDGVTFCSGDDDDDEGGDCPEGQDCVGFSDTCATGRRFCTEDLDVPAEDVCTVNGPASSPKACSAARKSGFVKSTCL